MLAYLGRRKGMRFSTPTWRFVRGVSGVAKTIPKERVDAVVIGAGVVGLAVARELSLRGREVLILDAASSFGTVTSSRNSEVVHAGIYYPPNSLKGEAENNHATFSYNTVVLNGRVEEKKMHLFVAETGLCEAEAQLELIPNLVVNSAGLGAQALAKRFQGLDHRFVPSSHYARGCYFTLSGTKSPPFSKLVYPIPEEGGLGVHVTLDLNGLVKFGPDVEWIECTDDQSSFLNKFDYRVKTNRAEKFYPEIRMYYPDLKDGSLEPGYSGIRPKLSGPKQPPTDFVIQGEETHGVPGLVNLFGIESPGLTSSLAIAEHIANKFLR